MIIVSGRGTRVWDVYNWVADIEFLKVAYKDIPNAYVHDGFLKAYSSVSADIL